MFRLMWKRLYVVLGCLLLATSTLAQPNPVIRLDPALAAVPLAGRMEWLEDASTQMTLAQVQAAPGWTRLPGLPNFGYTYSAHWLRLTLEQPAEAKSDWRLEIDNSMIDEIRLHSPAADGSWQLQRAGVMVDRADWPLTSRPPVFRIQLQPGQHTVYLRLQSRHTMTTSMYLLTTDRYRVQSNREALVFGAYFGVYAVVIVLQLFFWLMGHDRLSAWYFLYTVVLFFGTLLSSGYPQIIFDMSAAWVLPAIGIYLCLAPTVLARLTSLWLALDQQFPRFDRIYQYSVYTAAVISGALVLVKDYQLGVSLGQFVTLPLLLVSTGLGFWLWRKRVPNAGFYVMVFSFVDIAILTRYLRNLGLAPAGVFVDYALFVGTMLHLVAMSLYFIYRFNHLQSSLRLERTAREEQRDFIGMVSHEFRTPLAIINTSIQQLAGNLDAPVEKSLQRAQNIRNAVQRMDLLLDDYLSLDRLDSAHQAVKLQPCDFFEVIEDATSDWPLGRIQIKVRDLPASFVCDPDLMRIVLRNLLANAIRHSPADSTVHLEVTGTERQGLHILVRDQGDGIPADELPRLFQKYFRGRASQGQPGAGLGLYLVRRIIHAHGGTIEVQSAQGQGTTFHVQLPPGGLPRS